MSWAAVLCVALCVRMPPVPLVVHVVLQLHVAELLRH